MTSQTPQFPISLYLTHTLTLTDTHTYPHSFYCLLFTLTPSPSLFPPLTLSHTHILPLTLALTLSLSDSLFPPHHIVHLKLNLKCYNFPEIGDIHKKTKMLKICAFKRITFVSENNECQFSLV